MSITLAQWMTTGLVPTSGLIAWHQCEEGHSLHNTSYDHSVNARDLTCLVSGQPAATANVLNGHPAWYFDGTSNPLSWTGTIPNAKHVFIIAASDEAAFPSLRGLLSGPTSGDVLTSEASGTKWFDFSYGADFVYRKSDVLYANSNLQAPMNSVFELMEIQSPVGGLPMDGIQIGQHKTLTGRKWKGYFAFLLMYDRVLTTAEVARIRLFTNLYYNLHRTTALPLYFPSDDIVPIKRRRFYASVPDYDSIIDSWEYEDKGADYNAVSDTAPRTWEYDYRLVNTAASTDPPEVKIFDEFYEVCRGKLRPFNFTDKYGTTWTNVRVKSYNRTHSAHKAWTVDCKFVLMKSP